MVTSKYARVNLFVGKYNVPSDGHIKLGDDAHVMYIRGREKADGWEEDPEGDVWLIVEDGGFWPVMIRLDEHDEHLGPGRSAGRLTNETIRWTATSVPVGMALIATTRHGLCAVRLGDDTDSLAAELRTMFPNAALIRDDAPLSDAASAVSDIASGHARPDASAIPLDAVGADFQQRVWEALRHIPFGETRTYAQVASLIGEPRSARAVGAACAANPIVLIVPCHRVVGSNGSLGGYVYGQALKRRLIDAESAIVGK